MALEGLGKVENGAPLLTTKLSAFQPLSVVILPSSRFVGGSSLRGL